MERRPIPTQVPVLLEAFVNAMAYRLLRDVRQEGAVSWGRAEASIPDASILEAAVDWLHDRGLVCIDKDGLAAPRVAA